MAESMSFDFSAPAADVTHTSPTGQELPPIAGSSRATKHASWTGAKAVAGEWTVRVSAYLQLLDQAGALDDYEAFQLLKWGGVSSVNSVRGWLRTNRPGLLVEDGFNAHTFVDAGGTERTTRRTRWRVNR